ncbi:MAG: hypothetical protein JWQ49_5111 [Edaphobacter sp.]|jgi:hypothetical protein|nr:hypothetical protein [Edaphobacter sp.]
MSQPHWIVLQSWEGDPIRPAWLALHPQTAQMCHSDERIRKARRVAANYWLWVKLLTILPIRKQEAFVPDCRPLS